MLNTYALTQKTKHNQKTKQKKNYWNVNLHGHGGWYQFGVWPPRRPDLGGTLGRFVFTFYLTGDTGSSSSISDRATTGLDTNGGRWRDELPWPGCLAALLGPGGRLCWVWGNTLSSQSAIFIIIFTESAMRWLLSYQVSYTPSEGLHLFSDPAEFLPHLTHPFSSLHNPHWPLPRSHQLLLHLGLHLPEFIEAHIWTIHVQEPLVEEVFYAE